MAKKPTPPAPICMHENVKAEIDGIVVCSDCGEVQEFPQDTTTIKAEIVPEPAPERSLALVQPKTTENPYTGIAAAPFDERAEAVLSAPLDVALVSFRPDGLAYVPQVHYRDALNRAFGRGNWGVRPIAAPLVKNNHVYYHGGLYVGGRFVAEGVGEAEYFEESANASWGSAWESARSDAITRCCKDLGLFRELWDHKYLEPLKQRWLDEERPSCPNCGKPEHVRPSKDGGWFCWAKKGGCGWQGPEPRRGSKPAGPPPSRQSAVQPARPAAPTPQDPTAKPTTAQMQEFTHLMQAMDDKQQSVWMDWCGKHETQADFSRALERIKARMKAEAAK